MWGEENDYFANTKLTAHDVLCVCVCVCVCVCK